MKKFLVVMMCLIMTVCFMPTMAWADGLPLDHPSDNLAQCTSCVASVTSKESDTKYYDSLATAIDAAADGDIVKLLRDFTVDSLVTVSKNITLDLGNYTLTADNNTMSGNSGKGFVIQTTGDIIIQNGHVNSTVCRGISASAGTLNLKNVKINTFKRGLFVDNAVVTVDKNCIITTSGPDSPVVIWGTGDYHTDDTYQHATLHFYGSADATNASGGDYAAVTGNGSDNSYTYIYIYSGATLTSRGHALYAPQAGEVTIKGGTLTGGGAVGVKSGKLTITGGTLKGTGAYIESPKSSGNGIDGDGSAINIDSNGGYAGNMEISISGTAKLNSTNGHAIREIGAEDDTTSVVSLNITKGTFTAATGKDAVLVRDITKDKTSITGGTYSSNPGIYVPESHEVLNSAHDTYVVKSVNSAVACIGDKKFDTLSNAITAAQANDTVMLLNDATASNIYIKKSITLDLSGFSVKKSIVRSGLFKINADGVTFSIINSNTTKVSSLNGYTTSGQYTIATLEGTNAAQIIIGKNVTVKGNTVVLFGKEPTLDVYGTIDTEGTLNPPIMTNGSTTTNSVIKINEGAEIKTSRVAAIYHPDGGTITVSGGTITGAHGIQMCSGKLIINGSPEITATGKKNISAAGNDGTIPDGAAISVINRNYPGGVPSVTISGTPAIKSLDGENALWAYNWNSSNKTAEEWGDGKKYVSISGGYFTSDPTVYLATGKSIVTSDKAGFAYKVGDSVTVGGAEVSPAPDTTPKADVSNIAQDDKDAVKTAIEGTRSTGLNAEAAAVAEDSNKVTENHVSRGLAAVQNESFGTGVNDASDIKLVVQPYLDIKAQSYTTTDEGNNELAVEITPKYNLLATKSDTDITTLNTTGTGGEKNAVVVAENKNLPVDQNTQVTITFQLPSGFITDAQMDKLFVVHTKKDGSKETYKANVTKSGDNYIATFTTNGFSPFVFMVDSRTATVTFDGTSKTYVASNVGEALPTSTAPSGKVFGGWTFEGISGTYTTLTDDLLTALNGRTVTATPYFYTPNYGGGGSTVTTSLDKAKNEASKAVTEYVKPAEYEAAEQAEIKAITEKAIADIKNAKTEAEVKTIEAAAKAEIDKLETAEEKAIIRTIEATKFKARSKATTLNGKKAIRVTWNVPEGMEFDGFEVYRSTEKYKGFGTEPIFITQNQKYTNNKGLEVGKTYYYKVRAFKYVNDEKVYTEYSYKAIRTVK